MFVDHYVKLHGKDVIVVDNLTLLPGWELYSFRGSGDLAVAAKHAWMCGLFSWTKCSRPAVANSCPSNFVCMRRSVDANVYLGSAVGHCVSRGFTVSVVPCLLRPDPARCSAGDTSLSCGHALCLRVCQVSVADWQLVSLARISYWGKEDVSVKTLCWVTLQLFIETDVWQLSVVECLVILNLKFCN